MKKIITEKELMGIIKKVLKEDAESKKAKKQVVLNENQLRGMVKKAVTSLLKENYPLGAKNDPRAPYNETDDGTMVMTAHITAYYSDEDGVDEIQKEFDVDIDVPCETEFDGEGTESYPTVDPREIFDAHEHIPPTLENGYELYDYDVEFD